MLKDFFLSPPFGSYLSHPAATSVLGTFTLSERLGKTAKIFQFFLDNIRYPVKDGYRNRMELRNPGVGSIDVLQSEYVYSLAGLERYDWMAMLYVLANRTHIGRIRVELNLGCQNVGLHPIPNAALERFCQSYDVIAKLPADVNKALAIAERCAEYNIAAFHIGNTVKDDIGSLSGYPAKRVNLPICEQVATRFPRIPIIGGGGIYSYVDLMDYLDHGATQFSLGTVWFTPWRALKLIRSYQEAKNALRNPAESPA